MAAIEKGPVIVTSTSRGNAVFTCAGVVCTAGEIVDAAYLRGDFEGPWQKTLRGLAASNHADEQGLDPDLEAVEAKSDAFRYARDLVAVEDTEAWLAARGLDAERYSDALVRDYWSARLRSEVEPVTVDYALAADEWREWACIDGWLSGAMDRLMIEHAWRQVALATARPGLLAPAAQEAVRARWSGGRGWAEQELLERLTVLGRTSAWHERLVAAEVAYERCCETVLTETNRKRALVTLHASLLRLDCEVLELESENAAHEAFLCVRDDGVSMRELAREALYPFQRCVIRPDEFPAPVGAMMAGVRPGTVLAPWPRGDGYRLCRVRARIEPELDDAAIRARVDQEILNHHYEGLVAAHIHWCAGPPADA